jgi:hypothetical protein
VAAKEEQAQTVELADFTVLVVAVNPIAEQAVKALKELSLLPTPRLRPSVVCYLSFEDNAYHGPRIGNAARAGED